MYLLHPRMDHTETTISQHYYWTNFRDDIINHINVCRSCNNNKKQILKCGLLPDKEAEAINWDRSLVYIITTYKIIREDHNAPLILKALTIKFPETGWLKIIQYKDKQEYIISNLEKQTWLCTYLRPKIIIYVSENELLSHAFKNELTKNRYRIKSKCETIVNTQVNSIFKRNYQVIENFVCTFDMKNNYFKARITPGEVSWQIRLLQYAVHTTPRYKILLHN